MNCFACNDVLSSCISLYLDDATGRLYCINCQDSIQEVIKDMTPNPEPKKPDYYDLEPGEVELLDGDWDSDDSLLYGSDLPDEDSYDEFSLPPENYNE